MLIADTSAWVEFLRATGTAEAARLRVAIAEREVVVIEPVLGEVMAGVRRKSVLSTMRLLEAQRLEALAPKRDWLDAAEIYRELRWRGVTIRSFIDVLVAAAAIRLELPVLHRDRDFGLIAQYTDLEVV